MSKDTKFCARPKVRFTSTVESDQESENSQGLLKQRSNGPKIRSIVTLEKPVKIINANQIPDKIIQRESPAEYQDSTVLKPHTSINISKTDHLKPLCDSSNCQNIKANSDDDYTLQSPNNNVGNTSLKPPTVKEDSCMNEVLQSHSNVNGNIRKGCLKSKDGKENKQSNIKKSIKTINTLSKKVSNSMGCPKTPVHKKPNICTTDRRKSIVPQSGNPSASLPKDSVKKPISNTKCICKTLTSKPTVAGVMACHKYTKLASKAKISPVKKTVVRDIMGHKMKPYIGPGILRKKPEQFQISENADHRTHASSEKLARPEYNSIMCTINKLKEVKKEKIITDIKHLPTAYKNLVNGKVSAALDFPLEETIYKNLVDLVIDDKQLPHRIMRSKDPEPRQRDIVPVLSDFFTPTSTEEYCSSVCVNSRAPESVEDWNAFSISDKIVEWKYSVDHIQ